MRREWGGVENRRPTRAGEGRGRGRQRHWHRRHDPGVLGVAEAGLTQRRAHLLDRAQCNVDRTIRPPTSSTVTTETIKRLPDRRIARSSRRQAGGLLFTRRESRNGRDYPRRRRGLPRIISPLLAVQFAQMSARFNPGEDFGWWPISDQRAQFLPVSLESDGDRRHVLRLCSHQGVSGGRRRGCISRWWRLEDGGGTVWVVGRHGQDARHAQPGCFPTRPADETLEVGACRELRIITGGTRSPRVDSGTGNRAELLAHARREARTVLAYDV